MKKNQVSSSPLLLRESFEMFWEELTNLLFKYSTESDEVGKREKFLADVAEK